MMRRPDRATGQNVVNREMFRRFPPFYGRSNHD